MREILFRGKRLDNGEWVEGYYTTDPIGVVIRTHKIIKNEKGDTHVEWSHRVDPTTIGQFTGLLDKNGKRVFEGDVLKDMAGDIFTVFYNSAHCAFMCEYQKNSFKRKGFWRMDDQCSLGIEVVGNIHKPRGENDEE